MLGLTLAALVGWLVVAALPWQPWRTREHLEADPDAPTEALSEITVLVPARNEARNLRATLEGLAAQGRFARVVVIDDQSDDGTGDIARAAGIPNLEVLDGTSPPAGASGKLWALTQGYQSVETPLVLLLDADIVLEPGIIATLARRRALTDLGLASLMVHLSMQRPWEKVLIPAFVYFFKLLYPFALANARSRWVAAAAGGCILTTRRALDDIGGFPALEGALIDDCTLARRIKDSGRRTWVGLTRSARSARPYDDLAEIWNMVARTAFTQLKYSWWLLGACTCLMALYFVVPPIALLAGSPLTRGIAVATLLVAGATYWPTLRYYRLHPGLTATLPMAGCLYLAMTWTSAVRYLRGERSRWKARVYDRTA